MTAPAHALRPMPLIAVLLTVMTMAHGCRSDQPHQSISLTSAGPHPAPATADPAAVSMTASDSAGFTAFDHAKNLVEAIEAVFQPPDDPSSPAND